MHIPYNAHPLHFPLLPQCAYNAHPLHPPPQVIRTYAKTYNNIADFAFVYISEAHAKDEWPLGHVESYDQPTQMEERLALARRFDQEYNDIGNDMSNMGMVSSVDIPVVVDTM